MPRVITNLCQRDASCVEVCPVDCIAPGEPVEEYPTFYIDPETCIDCGACETECPHSAIFELEEVSADYEAEGGETLSAPADSKGFDEELHSENSHAEPVFLPAVRYLEKGEIVDLTAAIENNSLFFTEGPGYSTQ